MAFISAGNTIGGTAPGAGNLISGNNLAGILLQPNTTTPNIGSTGNLIEGNLIGTQPGGNQANGNFGDGILIFASPGNTVGGTTPAVQCDPLATEGFGITIMGEQATLNVVQGTEQATLNVVQGNFIGTNASGSGVETPTAPSLPFLSNHQGGDPIQNRRPRERWWAGPRLRRCRTSSRATSGRGRADHRVDPDNAGRGRLHRPRRDRARHAIGNTGSGVVLDGVASGNTIGGTDPA